MTDYSFLLAIAGVLAIGAMSPGPSFFVVARNSLNQSRAHGLATALGTGFGVAVFALLASLGVTALIETVPLAFLVFKIIGGLYLLYLAWRIWIGAHEPLEAQDVESRVEISRWKAFSLGLFTQTSNPKTALVIAGIFAAFVPLDPPAYTAWLVALIAFIIDFSWYAFVAISLSTQRSRQFYQRAKFGLDRVAAAFLGVVGVKLLAATE